METTKFLQKRAGEGDSDAQFRVGYRLAFGKKRLRPTDWPYVLELWNRAAEAGHPCAQFCLGSCYDRGLGVKRDVKHAFEWYFKAAENGDVIAQYNVAFTYRKGDDGIPQDIEKGLFWLRKAAEHGDPDAQRDLGYCYHEGEGVPIDYKEAVRWYRKAAKAGDAKAQFNLWLCYRYGDGVSVSLRWARYWLERAASQGHRTAKRLLRELEPKTT